MKKFIAILVLILAAATAGITLYSHNHTAPAVRETAPAPSAQTEQAPAKNIEAKTEQVTPAPVITSEPAPVPVTNPVSNDVKPNAVPTALSQAVDTLVSPTASFTSRRELWQKLKEAGELDQVIAELKQRAANDPANPQVQTAIGVGLMNKFPVQDFNEAAMLGLQIDQSFSVALKADPANWEAQYEKADSMSYWPDAAGNKGPEIIQRLSSLIDQQETMTPQLEFAKTYVLLGKQYQKAGKPEYAQTTWQLGLAKFPNDTALQKALNSVANH